MGQRVFLSPDACIRARHRPYLRYAASQIIRQGPPQAACLGLVGWFAMWQTRPQAAHPRAPAARGANKGRDPQSGQGPNARRLNCGRARAAPQRARTPPRGSAAGRRSGAGPLRRAGLAQAEPHQRRQSRRRASAGRLAGARPDRAGGADGPTAPTEWGPGRAGAPTPRPARGRSKARPRRRRAPKGAWPCFAEGYPRATAGGWQAPQGRRPEPPQAATSRHMTPTATGGRGGRRPSRPGWAGVAARRPLGAGGTRPEGADGSPHQPAGLASSCLAVSSTKPRGRRVGRAGPRPGPFTARPKGRAQTEAATRPRPGARAEAPRSAPPRGDPAPRGRKKARPSGRAICYLEPYRAGVVRS
jgi:hypothetical protein